MKPETIGIILGAFLVIGTKCRWSFLVDPPGFLAWFYEKIFGSDSSIPINYLIGTTMIIFSLLFWLSRLERLLVK